MARRLRWVVAGLLLPLGVLAAELVTEVIPLGFRTVDEVVPILRPLVPQPGAVTGLRDQLVVRTTPANMAEIKSVLASLDHAPRSLLISVRRDDLDRFSREGASARMDIHEGDARLSAGAGPPERGGRLVVEDDGGNRARVNVYGTGDRASAGGVQTVRALEGRDAFISTGTELPLRGHRWSAGPWGMTSSETIDYRRVGRGFLARTTVNGDRVRVEIRSGDARLEPGGNGAVRSREADTVVAGRLGEWLLVGSDNQQEGRTSGGIGYAAGSDRLSQSALMLKVDLVP